MAGERSVQLDGMHFVCTWKQMPGQCAPARPDFDDSRRVCAASCDCETLENRIS